MSIFSYIKETIRNHKTKQTPSNYPKSESVTPTEDYQNLPSSGTSGFHHFSDPSLPFSVCGWATFKDLEHVDFGVAFRINEDYFKDRDAVLYYMDKTFLGDLHESVMAWLPKLRDRIEAYSSGLTDIRICEQVEHNDFHFRGNSCSPTTIRMIQFRLDSSKIKEYVEISEELKPTSELGEYIFVLPREGEFFIELGEIVDGQRIPLHIDDFCMK